MPEVTIWIDPEPCDGDCDVAMDLRSGIRAALDYLEAGSIGQGVSILRKMASDPILTPTERLLSQWMKTPLPREQFEQFAARLRKEKRDNA